MQLGFVSKNAVGFEIMSITVNSANPSHVAVCGYQECHVLKFDSSGMYICIREGGWEENYSLFSSVYICILTLVVNTFLLHV